MFNHEKPTEEVEVVQSEKERVPHIKDLDEAREFIEDRFEAGERPVITVPEQYVGYLEDGLKAHSTWIPGLDVIAGTFGRDPYIPDGEKRTIVEVTDIALNQIQPRMTGDGAFQGIVTIRGPIAPEALTIH